MEEEAVWAAEAEAAMAEAVTRTAEDTEEEAMATVIMMAAAEAMETMEETVEIMAIGAVIDGIIADDDGHGLIPGYSCAWDTLGG